MCGFIDLCLSLAIVGILNSRCIDGYSGHGHFVLCREALLLLVGLSSAGKFVFGEFVPFFIRGSTVAVAWFVERLVFPRIEARASISKVIISDQAFI